MSTRAQSRKRRRSQAFPEDTIDGDESTPTYVESTGQDRLEKEREVWDAFKDEHVEVFDLSSSLLRRFDLVRELDQQDSKNTASLLSTFMEYVDLRRTTPAHAEPPGDPDASHSSREMLAIIAKFSEASIRDREEKVNLTLAACDSVERSIRLIDQAIHEQEHAISLGARAGTHLAPILLPEIAMPKLNKQSRVALSPDLDDALGTEPQAPTQARRKKGRRGRKKSPVPSEAAVPLPRPKPPVIPNADPNEPRYCYCDQVSFGEMIACDDPHCTMEWFHLSCTNLGTAPEGRKKWFCDACKLRKKGKKKP
ncbi:hypothetical protein B0H11DRAFT_2261396 [Mycena galericulata]|nr:hypothetical protein B0H11DRAFT_2261396 [Mycena galericulata]